MNVELIDIVRNATRYAVDQGIVLIRQIRVKKRGLFIIQRQNLKLGRSAPIQGAFRSQNLALHKTHR